ncbi:hypothetical protein [Paenibacillus agricola]|uniref:Uncharacterized protein n=1 Tax=Paenibacillus agricola TaxID=2716264 RepID=A0ABX0J004_9BACL|nr:hypothetical protein [Paenibacillus agricola]NHN28242.1 hypothetical protein [Paenibacillus agricola]
MRNKTNFPIYWTYVDELIDYLQGTSKCFIFPYDFHGHVLVKGGFQHVVPSI